MTAFDLFYRFGLAALIGLLVGLQREFAFHTEAREQALFAGVRTFALLGLLGCTSAFLAETLQIPLIVPVVLAVVGGVVVGSYVVEANRGGAGTTTEVAALLVVLLGALSYTGAYVIAAAMGVAITVLLAVKTPSHRFVEQLSREDVYATLKFAVITAIVLPLLPKIGYGPPPFDVLVPYNIWLMVVLISGISFVGYICIRALGPRRGLGLTGVLGGLASSTAVTLTFSQRSRTAPALARPFALAILLAWGAMFLRILIEVAALNRPLLRLLWLPLVSATLVIAGCCLYLYLRQPSDETHEADAFKNPFELGPALLFGLLYAGILLVVHLAEMGFGTAGIYVSSVLSGMADVDAITLSIAELSQGGERLDLQTAARAIVLAAASNTVVKGGLVLSAGSAALRKAILPGFLLTLAAALGVGYLV